MSDEFKRAGRARPGRTPRIKPPVWPRQLMRTLRNLGAGSSSTSSEPKQMRVDATEHLRMLADLATNLWRLQQKMLQPGTNEPHAEMRSAYRSFEAAWNTLSQAGVEIQDHTGNLFNSGLLLRVLAFQQTPDITQETVLETIRPSVYYKQQLIQPGEVIVGTPEYVTPPPASTIDSPSVTEQIMHEQGDTIHEQSDH